MARQHASLRLDRRVQTLRGWAESRLPMLRGRYAAPQHEVGGVVLARFKKYLMLRCDRREPRSIGLKTASIHAGAGDLDPSRIGFGDGAGFFDADAHGIDPRVSQVLFGNALDQRLDQLHMSSGALCFN